MPLIPGLLRRRGPSSDVDMRRHSLLLSPDANNQPVLGGRASEQIPRRPSPAEFLTPSALSPAKADRSAARRSSMVAEVGADPLMRSVSPPVQDETQKHRRFSMLKFRNASDSQLSSRARFHAARADAPPLPHPPAIITTAPTMEMNVTKPTKKKSRVRMPGRRKSSMDIQEEEPMPTTTLNDKKAKKERRKTMTESAPSGSKSRVTFDEPARPSPHAIATSPPAYGDEAHSTLALPVTRLSESSRSDGSCGDHGVYATTTTTTHTVHTTTTFFRLPRRKKTPAPFFDLSHLPQKSNPQDQAQLLAASRASASSSRLTAPDSPSMKALRSPSVDDVGGHSHTFGSPLPSPSHSAILKSSAAFATPGAPLFRQGSSASSISSPTRARLTQRGRSSTLNSLRNMPSDDNLPTPTLPPSGRTSTSTGRKSFGDLFGLSHRLRQNSEPPYPRNSNPATPGSNTSKNNSMQLVREPAIVLPERYEDDTPAKYLVRLEEAVSRGVVASVLSKGTDPFSQAVLRSYMRGFGFFGDPMDMAIRKLLMEVELPKETQQIDRCLQGFANRYHECNPGIYASPDQAYFIAFSLLILHTDVFNPNNKHKMQKHDYLKNTRGEGIFDEILGTFYDNISYTPFIHVEDDLDINGERIIQHKTKKKSIFPRANVDPTKRPSKEPVDPYTLIIDSKLDTLRPNLKEVMYLEEHYSYLGTAPSLNLQDLQKTFFRTGILQIVSARSRPDAFMSEKTVSNPEEAHPGIVDIKITKVGLLWRKDAKKKKTRSPWQEWGAILTGAQLYFFRNTNWIKSLMHQLETHTKQGHDGIPVIFKPPLEQFKPDALMSTDDAVALLDSTYKKHKNAFVFVRHGGFEETFLADNEHEMNDWLAKLNYAAAFRTSGVRMRGVVGGNYEGQRTRGIRRLESRSDSAKSVQTPTGEVTIISGKIDTKMAHDILCARREIMQQKIQEAEEKLAVAQKQLDTQLRNARHLQILAPIQQKTREQIILAAGRMAAQLKWGRMEIWRLRCHKDILSMDLEEESKSDGTVSKQETVGETPSSDRIALARLPSKASSVTPQRAPRSPTQSAYRPSTSAQQSPQYESDLQLDDFFQAPPALSSPATFQKQQASWELPPLKFDAQKTRKASVSSAVPSSPNLASTPSKASLRPVSSGDQPRPSTPRPDATEQAVLEQAGLLESDKSPIRKRPSDLKSEESKDQVAEKDKLDRGKIRRSLHRTLRDAHVPTHHRSRKGKDSASSAILSEEGSREDVLSRGTGSFTVHGKKASVIQFGSELQNMSPEERLRLRKQPHKDEFGGSPSAAFDSDFNSMLAEPLEFRERHGSAATASSATAKSFKELHNRIRSGSSSIPGIITSDGYDSEVAVSFSDGRRTPLPPVEDEDGRLSRPVSHNAQAAFYTPEASNSPVREEFSEKNQSGTDEADDAEGEKLHTPLPPTSVGA
ncbi:Sec7 protein [Venustampulla echinocandica]|uniref:Sec7 protein n=1 Tax=Venustampulla echinocandica TaxID=2656787 RepID=A0A370T9I6_9HELO|nr:Sec7 protein [Venustampulla echinocandica]RDL30232.1 Sec7 protein [Venustampulla echinocandica]